MQADFYPPEAQWCPLSKRDNANLYSGAGSIYTSTLDDYSCPSIFNRQKIYYKPAAAAIKIRRMVV
jgi:hypothetical protein